MQRSRRPHQDRLCGSGRSDKLTNRTCSRPSLLNPFSPSLTNHHPSPPLQRSLREFPPEVCGWAQPAPAPSTAFRPLPYRARMTSERRQTPRQLTAFSTRAICLLCATLSTPSTSSSSEHRYGRLRQRQQQQEQDVEDPRALCPGRRRSCVRQQRDSRSRVHRQRVGRVDGLLRELRPSRPYSAAPHDPGELGWRC